MSTSAPPASSLYKGIVVHRRFGAKRHALRYRMFMALLDLDELDALDARLKLFSRNRFNLFSFVDRDHLPIAQSGKLALMVRRPKAVSNHEGGPSKSPPGALVVRDARRAPHHEGIENAPMNLRAMVEARLTQAGLEPDGGAIRLLSLPRILGYAFNPLSVYFCHRRDGSLAAILYEVNNTFKQRHTYVIPAEPDGDGTIRQRCDKAFYVSPFLDMDLTYDFRVVPPGERISVAVDGSRGADRVIAASFAGERALLSDASLLRAFLAYPLLSFAVVAGIHWEALKLWLKGVGLVARPAPPLQSATFVPRREV